MIWTDCVCGPAVCRVEKIVHCVLTVGDERYENMRYPVAAKVRARMGATVSARFI